MEERSLPELNQYFYSYHVKITNNSDQPIRIDKRDLTIKESNGKVWKNEGSGVLGEHPKLDPSATHEYTSFAPLNCSTGSIRGKFLVQGHETFWIEFPLTFLRME